MKKLFPLFTAISLLLLSFNSIAQKNEDKSKRPSPPAFVKETNPLGALLSIDYSQPSVKGRTIGKDLEPKNGEIWRTGANEATIFETTKEVKINGQVLPAGKYSLFTISGDEEWSIIFNKTWKQWGAYSYKQSDDALRIKVKPIKSEIFSEKLLFTIEKNGTVTLLWGDVKVSFVAE